MAQKEKERGISSINHQSHGVGSIQQRFNETYNQVTVGVRQQYVDNLISEINDYLQNTKLAASTVDVSLPPPDGYVSPIARNTVSNTDTTPEVPALYKDKAVIPYRDSNSVDLVDLYDPNTPNILNLTFTTLTAPERALIRGQYAFVMSDTYLASIATGNYDTTGTIVQEFSKAPFDGHNDMAFYGNDYIVDATFDSGASEGIAIWDISDPANMSLAGSYQMASTFGCQSVVVDGDTVYAGDRPVDVVDISDPTNPTRIGSNTSGNVQSWGFILPSDSSVYCSYTSNSGVEEVDISDPANPTLTGTVYNGFPNTLFYRARVGNYVYVGDGNTYECHHFPDGLDSGTRLFQVTPIDPVEAFAATEDMVLATGLNNGNHYTVYR